MQVQKSCEIKSRKFTGCLRGRGYQKDQMGVYVVTVPAKNFPWWLAVKSRIWLLMSSRVTHVINGTASWNLLESYKFLSHCLLSLSPCHSPTPISRTPCTFPRWWCTGVEKAAVFRVCSGKGAVPPVTGTFMNSGSYSKNI